MATNYVGLTISYKNGTYVISAKEARLTSANTLQDFVDYWSTYGSPTGEEIGYSLTEGGTAIDLNTTYGSAFPSIHDDNYLYALYSTVYPETIAGQISRLQDAKACIKAAIEEKGVTIGSDVTLDGYASCIAEIPTGASFSVINTLLVGGGGGGGCADNTKSGCAGGGGGGAGGVLLCQGLIIDPGNYDIVIGNGGGTAGGRGGNTCFGEMFACGGGGGSKYFGQGGSGGSGGGSGAGCRCNGGCGISGQGHDGDKGEGWYGYGGGGGGAGAAGSGRCGGDGIVIPIGNGSICFSGAGGGGGGSAYDAASGTSYCNSCCGSGGWGGSWKSGRYTGQAGKAGIAYIWYCNCYFSGSGGCLTVDGDYNIHTFTSNGTFCITG